MIARAAGRRLLAWVIEHNSHGCAFDTLCWLPDGDFPNTPEAWRRIPWLDEPLYDNTEQIASYVQGDGTDAQRVALADGIREGRKGS